MRAMRVSLVGLLVFVVIACASAPREEVDETSVNALYSSLESAVSRYQDGLQALRGGDQDSARGLMASAAQDLVSGGNACANTPG